MLLLDCDSAPTSDSSEKELWLRRRLNLCWAPLMAALTFNVITAQHAYADPLVPPTPAEIDYLNHAHLVFAAAHDPAAFRSDGELLSDGRYACDKRAAGFVGTESTLVSPALTQLAFIYLCP